MLQTAVKVFVLCSLISCYVCKQNVLDLSGWTALPLENSKVVNSIVIASDHIGGRLKEAVTAFKLDETVPEWDLYRVSFRTVFPSGTLHECYADVVWMFKPNNVQVYNTECLLIDGNDPFDKGAGIAAGVNYGGSAADAAKAAAAVVAANGGAGNAKY